MSELRKRMMREMDLRNFAPKTKQAYTHAVAGLANYYKRQPDKISQKEVEDYLLYLKNERKLSFNTRNVAASAFKFFYNTTLKDESCTIDLPPRKGPTLLHWIARSSRPLRVRALGL